MRHVFRAALAAVLVTSAIAIGFAPPSSPFPLPPVPTPAPPAPATGELFLLTPECYYVVDAKTDAALRVHPSGLVSVTKETGPIRLRGRFVDGDKVETRTYAGPCVYILEAVPGKTGRLEIDLIPYGFKADTDIQSVAVEVDGGGGPRPPPVPPPDPKPPVPPGPTPPIKVESFRVIYVVEKMATLSADQYGAIYGKAVRDYVVGKVNKTGTLPDRRVFDKDDLAVTETGAIKAMWAAVKPAVTVVPCAAVEVNGKVEIINLEATEGAMIAKFKSYLGEK